MVGFDRVVRVLLGVVQGGRDELQDRRRVLTEHQGPRAEAPQRDGVSSEAAADEPTDLAVVTASGSPRARSTPGPPGTVEGSSCAASRRSRRAGTDHRRASPTASRRSCRRPLARVVATVVNDETDRLGPGLRVVLARHEVHLPNEGGGLSRVPWCRDSLDSHATVMMRLRSKFIGVSHPSWL